jgi:hypothetical protein
MRSLGAYHRPGRWGFLNDKKLPGQRSVQSGDYSVAFGTCLKTGSIGDRAKKNGNNQDGSE